LTASQTGAILQELKDLRARLDRQGQANPPSRPPAPAEPLTGTVPLGPGPTLGKPDAPLVLVEFTDYQCPYCKRFDETVMAELKKNFVDSGQLRIVSHNLPLSFHSNAEGAALAALCADQQKQYWPMREKLFANSAALLATNLFKAAAELKLDLTAFQSCLEGKIFAGQIKKESEEAAAVGITGTPSFVIGKEAQGKVTGVIVVGAQPYATFESQIKKLLATAK
jgi:protein-disulfide isomerase